MTQAALRKDYYHQEAAVVMAENAVRISEAALAEHHIVAHRSGAAADAFRMLRTQVLQLMAQNGLRTLGITSPNYGDGKTTIALNLALSMALDLKQTVLLADLDLRKPDMMRYLGLSASKGLSDFFTNDASIADCLVRPAFDRLALLPAGPALTHSSEALGSPKMAALAEEMKSRYADRLVIYDLPPVLAQDDPLVFAPHVDGLLLVVNEGVSLVQDIKTCLHRLSNARVIGTVLNHAPDSRK